MKKFFIYALLSCLCINNAQAQATDVLADENTISSDKASDNIDDFLFGANAEENSDENSDDSEDDEESGGSFFSFITKPLSLLFSADDIVEDGGKKETYLEKNTRLAEEGNLDSQMNLGYMYIYGTNGVKQDYEKALHYYTLAADQNNAIAVNNLGSMYFNGLGTKVDIKKSLELFKKAADLGNDNAAVNLAFILLTGGTGDATRSTSAIELFKQGSEAGNKIAKFMLGYAYLKGFVVHQNYEKAFKLIKSCVAQDSRIDEAQIVLAEMFIQGKGTVQNYSNGIQLYRAAVGQGNMEAVMKLANIYLTGKIVPASPLLAHTLYNIAAANNIKGAAEKRDSIGEKMPLEMLSKVQLEAQSFQVNPSELTKYIRQTYGNNIRKYIDNNL